MKFNQHWNLNGKHALLSASSYSWLNYTPDKLVSYYYNLKKKEEGTLLHAFASTAIKRGIKLGRTKSALNMFVNDAIGFRMDSEVVLYYSDNVFGTADAITFKDGLLRIHDLKTGDGKVKFDQLHIYAALFCLEYDVDPMKIDIVERLYQGVGFTECVPDTAIIASIMDKIIEFDQIITNLKEEEGDR